MKRINFQKSFGIKKKKLYLCIMLVLLIVLKLFRYVGSAENGGFRNDRLPTSTKGRRLAMATNILTACLQKFQTRFCHQYPPPAHVSCLTAFINGPSLSLFIAQCVRRRRIHSNTVFERSPGCVLAPR